MVYAVRFLDPTKGQVTHCLRKLYICHRHLTSSFSSSCFFLCVCACVWFSQEFVTLQNKAMYNEGFVSKPNSVWFIGGALIYMAR